MFGVNGMGLSQYFGCRYSSVTGLPDSASRRMPRICSSVHRFFIVLVGLTQPELSFNPLQL
jgi:hypothetical protein